MKIRTNNHWREPVSWHDLPESEKPNFDYIEGEDRHSSRLFRYLNTWYDTGEFFAVPRKEGWALEYPDDFFTWHGYQSDSFFSGVVIRYSDDFEQIQIGTYFS